MMTQELLDEVQKYSGQQSALPVGHQVSNMSNQPQRPLPKSNQNELDKSTKLEQSNMMIQDLQNLSAIGGMSDIEYA